MRLHILGLGVGSVVDVAAYVEIEVMFVGDLGCIDEAAIFGEFALIREHKIDLLNIFRAKLVLILTFREFPVGIDEQYLVF